MPGQPRSYPLKESSSKNESGYKYPESCLHFSKYMWLFPKSQCLPLGHIHLFHKISSEKVYCQFLCQVSYIPDGKKDSNIFVKLTRLLFSLVSGKIEKLVGLAEV